MNSAAKGELSRAPPYLPLPDPDWSGCVPVSVCLFKPSLWEVFLVFLLTIFFFSVFSSLSILVSRAGPAGSHRVVPMVIGEEIASRMEDDWDGGGGEV